MNNQRTKLFTIPRTAFRIDTFRSGGHGGQNQNKRDTGVRITHIDSKQSAESRKYKSQAQNKKAAFRKLAERMKPWIKLKAAGIIDAVEKAMAPENIKTEYWDGSKWYE